MLSHTKPCLDTTLKGEDSTRYTRYIPFWAYKSVEKQIDVLVTFTY